MAEPRKVFRIEQTAALRLEARIEDPQPALHYAQILQELNALRVMLAATPLRSTGANALQRPEIERLTSELRHVHSVIGGTERDRGGAKGSRAQAAPTTRIAHELDAVMKGSEQATQNILAAAEDIDQTANNLSAALKGEIEQRLAQDIRDRVIQIFEACNFQDLTSQRVAKVMATLNRIEDQITRALAEATPAGAPTVHGPRLESDHGHVLQRDIDAIFGGGVPSA